MCPPRLSACRLEGAMPVDTQAAAVEAVHEACRKTVLALCGATVPGVSPEAGALVAEAYELLCRARRLVAAGTGWPDPLPVNREGDVS